MLAALHSVAIAGPRWLIEGWRVMSVVVDEMVTCSIEQ
jgi:hypothetical protein